MGNPNGKPGSLQVAAGQEGGEVGVQRSNSWLDTLPTALSSESITQAVDSWLSVPRSSSWVCQPQCYGAACEATEGAARQSHDHETAFTEDPHNMRERSDLYKRVISSPTHLSSPRCESEVLPPPQRLTLFADLEAAGNIVNIDDMYDPVSPKSRGLTQVMNFSRGNDGVCLVPMDTDNEYLAPSECASASTSALPSRANSVESPVDVPFFSGTGLKPKIRSPQKQKTGNLGDMMVRESCDLQGAASLCSGDSCSAQQEGIAQALAPCHGDTEDFEDGPMQSPRFEVDLDEYTGLERENALPSSPQSLSPCRKSPVKQRERRLSIEIGQGLGKTFGSYEPMGAPRSPAKAVETVEARHAETLKSPRREEDAGSLPALLKAAVASPCRERHQDTESPLPAEKDMRTDTGDVPAVQASSREGTDESDGMPELMNLSSQPTSFCVPPDEDGNGMSQVLVQLANERLAEESTGDEARATDGHASSDEDDDMSQLVEGAGRPSSDDEERYKPDALTQSEDDRGLSEPELTRESSCCSSSGSDNGLDELARIAMSEDYLPTIQELEEQEREPTIQEQGEDDACDPPLM